MLTDLAGLVLWFFAASTTAERFAVLWPCHVLRTALHSSPPILQCSHAFCSLCHDVPVMSLRGKVDMLFCICLNTQWSCILSTLTGWEKSLFPLWFLVFYLHTCVCAYLCTTCMQLLIENRGSIRSHGDGVADSCKLPNMGWELTLCSLPVLKCA